MYAACESLVVGDTLQKLTELSLLLDGERGKQSFLMFARNSSYGLQGNPPFFGEMERIAATIIRVVAPLDEPARFQLVHQGHKAAGEHAQNAGERLLCHRPAPAQDPENAGVRRGEIQRRQTLGKFCGCMGAKLRQQKCG
jgi:hypothetical protein